MIITLRFTHDYYELTGCPSRALSAIINGDIKLRTHFHGLTL